MLYQRLRLDQLRISPLNVRKSPPTAEKMEELKSSIADHGVLQNLVVRAVGADNFEILSGSRRFDAVRQLIDRGDFPSDTTLPCVVRDFSDADAIAVSLIENIQRADLCEIDEANAFLALYEAAMSDAGRAAAAEVVRSIASSIGRTVRYVQSRIQMARNLAEPIQEALRDGASPLRIDDARKLARLPKSNQVEAARGMVSRREEDLELFGCG